MLMEYCKNFFFDYSSLKFIFLENLKIFSKQEKISLLVSLQSGKVVEISFPEKSKVDTTSSYLLQNIEMR